MFFQCYTVTLDRDANTFKLQVEEAEVLEWVDIDRLKSELKTKPDKYIAATGRIIGELSL